MARIIRPSSGAEVAMVLAARRVARSSVAAVLAIVEKTWPETTESDVRRAIMKSLDQRAFVKAATRNALTISRANHRQLFESIKEFPRWNQKSEQQEAREEALEQWRDLVDRLIGSDRADGEIHDGDRPVTMLDSMMGRLRAKRTSNADILDALESLKAIAPEEELAAISRVRARVLGWEGKRNEKHQVDAGIKRYEWISKRDANVRPRHQELDGTTQRWSRPPVADTRTGYRAHPGGCKNCRCRAEPIVNRESLRIAARRARAES
jgi:SPP1 gp7 family putative phage head morphogenesis protein